MVKRLAIREFDFLATREFDLLASSLKAIWSFNDIADVLSSDIRRLFESPARTEGMVE